MYLAQIHNFFECLISTVVDVETVESVPKNLKFWWEDRSLVEAIVKLNL